MKDREVETENTGNEIKLASSWADLALQLPEYSPHYDNFIRGYSDVQFMIKEGNKHKAADKLDHLESDRYFLKFEQANKQLFAAIDIAVRGETNWVDEKDKPIKPSFTVNDIPLFKRDEN